jgi:hypothetical protein
MNFESFKPPDGGGEKPNLWERKPTGRKDILSLQTE